MQLQIILYILSGWAILFAIPVLRDLKPLLCPIKRAIFIMVNPQNKLNYKCSYSE